MSRAAESWLLAIFLTLSACGEEYTEATQLTRDPVTFVPPASGHTVTIENGHAQIDPVAEPISADEVVSYMCSECYRTVTREHVHVIPWFNDTRQNYVTTFRCDEHWQSSLAETRTHFLADAAGSAERAKLIEFFVGHEVPFRTASPEAREHEALEMLTRLANRELVLSP